MSSGTAMIPLRLGRQYLRRTWVRASLFKIISLIFAIAFGLLALYPVTRVLYNLLFPDGHFDMSTVTQVFTSSETWVLVRNTVLIVVPSGILAVAVGSLLAWLTVRTNARLRFVGNTLPLLPFLVPPIAGVIGWTVLLSPDAGILNIFIRAVLRTGGVDISSGPINIYSWPGMICIYSLYMIPFTFLLVGAGLRNMDPQMEEQARVSGAGPLKTIVTVTLPAVRANLGAAALLTVWFGFTFFPGPAILGPVSRINVLSVRIVDALSFTYPADFGTATGLSMFILVVVGLAWFAQVRLLRKGRFSTVSGHERSGVVDLGRWKWLGRAVIVVYAACASILPAAALVWVAVRGYWSSTLVFSGLNAAAFREVFSGDAQTRSSLLTSLELALVGATIGMLVSAVIARFVQTTPTILGHSVDALVKFTAPIPAVVLGVGFVLAFNGPPFNLNGTLLILLLVYLAHFLPQATVSADAAAAQVGPRLTEAAHISGAREGRTFWQVNIPLMLPGLLAGWGMLFLWILGEVNASIMLAGPSNPVIGLQIYNLYVQGTYGELAALSVVLMAVSLLVIVLVSLLGRWLRLGRAGVWSY